jgi:hypothetical protein
MIEKLVIEKEQIYISLETGEVVDTHAEAMKLYRAGHEIQIKYRYRYNGGEYCYNGGIWDPWIDGPYWAH